MSDIRNTSHRAPPFFEWWYFHFITPDGAALNMVLHETDILGKKADPYLSMSILLPGQSPVYLRRESAIGWYRCRMVPLPPCYSWVKHFIT